MKAPPSDTKVQMNLGIPWDFREFLREKAKQQGISLNALVLDTLNATYGPEFTRQLNRPPS